ncbi:MAG TPA: hypothetical protein VGQ69_10365 [Gemmatimonadales bacterium]|nr:hypothetical protein [Gemmatimonadales bacterium]
MSDFRPDLDLRELFQAVRVAERPHAPPYALVAASRRAGSGLRAPLRRSLLPAAAAAAGLVLLWLLLRRSELAAGDLEMARRVMAWQSPTAFLLESSTTARLVAIPRIGASVPGSPLRALDPGGPLGPPLTRSPRS